MCRLAEKQLEQTLLNRVKQKEGLHVAISVYTPFDLKLS